MYRAPTKKRGAWGDHKRLVYYFNVNRTSLDHLLLGAGADVDKLSSGHSIARYKRGGVEKSPATVPSATLRVGGGCKGEEGGVKPPLHAVSRLIRS